MIKAQNTFLLYHKPTFFSFFRPKFLYKFSAAGYRKKKEYLITDTGREVFYAERERISELAANALKMDGEVEA